MYGICVFFGGFQSCASPGNLQITDATVADLCHTLKTPRGDLAKKVGPQVTTACAKKLMWLIDGFV